MSCIIGGAFTIQKGTTCKTGELGLNIKLVATQYCGTKFLVDTIERSSEVEVEARKGYAIHYDKQHASCSDR
jgi:hypothetical protein